MNDEIDRFICGGGGGRSRLQLVLVILISVAIALIFFYGFCELTNIIVSDYTKDKQIVKTYDFYDLKIGANESAVYFIGNSVVGTAIYAPLIDEHLQEAGYNISAWNLKIEGSSPLDWSFQTHNIINSSPSLVIIGVRMADFNTNSWNSESVILVHNRLNIDADAMKIYSQNDELAKDLSTRPSGIYNKKFLLTAFLKATSISSKGFSSLPAIEYVKEPYGVNDRLTQDKRRNDEAILNSGGASFKLNTTTLSKESFVYMAHTLENAEIPVLIINMPVHPVVSSKTSDEARSEYFTFLNSTGVKWIDLEQKYGDSHFRDWGHSSWNGTQEFAQMMSNLIIAEVDKDVIHDD